MMISSLVIIRIILCESFTIFQSQFSDPAVPSNALPVFVSQMNCTIKVVNGKIASASGVTLSGPWVKITKDGWSDGQTYTASSITSPSWNHLITYPNCDNSFYSDGFKCNLFNNNNGKVIANGTYLFNSFTYGLNSDNPPLYDLLLSKITNDANVTVGLKAVVALTPCAARTQVSGSCSSPVDSTTCYPVGSSCSLCSGTTCSSCPTATACASKNSCSFTNDICQTPGAQDTCTSSTCSSCSGPTSCRAKDGCTWGDSCVDAPTPAHVFDCSTLLNQDICKKELSCRWNSASSSCGNDACFRANTIASVGTCTGTCTSSTSFVVNSNTWRMCYDANYHTGASTSCSYQYWTQATGNNNCQATACSKYGDSDICLERNLDNSPSDVCTGSYCSSCTGQNSCTNKGGCKWTDGCEDDTPPDECTGSGCASCSGETSCRNKDDCVWDNGCSDAPTTDRCTSNYCRSCTGQDSCTNKGGCVWENDECTTANAPTPSVGFDCASLLNTDTCKRELSCRWNVSTASCWPDECFRAVNSIITCTGTCTSSRSFTYNGASWMMCYDANYHQNAGTSCSFLWWTQADGNTACQNSNCDIYGDNVCLEAGLSNIVSDTCTSAACTSCSGPTSCYSHSSGCVWDNGCQTDSTDTCSGSSCDTCNGPSSCYYKSGCLWDGDICISNSHHQPTDTLDCSTLMNSEICKHELSCRWSNSANACGADECFRANAITSVGTCTGSCTSSSTFQYNDNYWGMCYDANYHSDASCSYRWWTQQDGNAACEDPACELYGGDYICLEAGLENSRPSTCGTTCSDCDQSSCESVPGCTWDGNNCQGTPDSAFGVHIALGWVALFLAVVFLL